MDYYDLQRTKEQIKAATEPLVAETTRLREEMRTTLKRLNQLELFVESLMNLNEIKKVFTADEWQVMVARVDLADGIEDGKRNPLEYRGAPVCVECKHYVNPLRFTCVYCGAAVPDPNVPTETSPYRGTSAVAPSPPKPKLIPCTGCNTVIPQNEAYFSSAGALVCAECFQA